MKRIVICGASSGIGKATALALSRTGCEVVLAARRRVLLEGLASQCEANGAKATIFPCDVTNFQECEQLMQAARDLGPGVEPVLVNSAGVAEFGDFAEMPYTSVDDQIKTNLLGPIYCCRAVLPWMLASGGGQIINILSIASKVPLAGSAAYSASKAGLLMFGKVLAAEYRKAGVRVTAVIPGATDTAIWDDQGFSPDKADMLSPDAVAQTVRDMVLMPDDRSIDEITIMPPKGIL
jgi:short-subunit dehydrogenase